MTMTIESDAVGGLRSPTWYETATRWTQLTLVEDDPGSFDLDFWLGVFDETKSNATCLSAGGYVAYWGRARSQSGNVVPSQDKASQGAVRMLPRSLGG